MQGQLSLFEYITVAALWKYDKELGIAFFCPNCKRFICDSIKCKCGANIDLNKPKIQCKGKVIFD